MPKSRLAGLLRTAGQSLLSPSSGGRFLPGQTRRGWAYSIETHRRGPGRNSWLTRRGPLSRVLRSAMPPRRTRAPKRETSGSAKGFQPTGLRRPHPVTVASRWSIAGPCRATYSPALLGPIARRASTRAFAQELQLPASQPARARCLPLAPCSPHPRPWAGASGLRLVAPERESGCRGRT